MAYNLQSLITILQHILSNDRWIVVDHSKTELESLLEKAVSLQQTLEKSSLSKINSLDGQIRDATHEAEDIIESQMVDQMLSTPGCISFTFCTPDLHRVTQKFDSVIDQVSKLVEVKTISSGSASSGASFSSPKSVVVGLDADLTHLKDRLTGTRKELEIIPIVGMGGIGKTTLARNLYDDPLIVEHFKFRAWTTISQDHNMQAILLSLLRCILSGKELDQHSKKNDHELKDILYWSLYGRRYIIVLDDIWSPQVWDEIRRSFPNNNNGSRIVITTRETDVAKYTDSRHHQVQLLNESISWNLLCHIVFGKDNCPNNLQEMGEKIASDCGGLPLAINVIGGLLSKVEPSRDAWENIENDVRAAIADSDEKFSKRLSLSYNHLPNHLKPCFLYIGAFPEDYKIKASKLIRLWVAEGFVKPKGGRSLEEEAKDYLKALVERNLLFVKEKKFNGKPKRYYIHDLLRDLCIQKADEEKFLHVKKPSKEVTFSNHRRVSVHTSSYASTAELMPLARSFLSSEKEIASSFLSAMRMLRVLDVKKNKFKEFPREILQLVNLRYLAISCGSGFPKGISRLCNLQTLIATIGSDRVPLEIWEMPELRHLKLNKTIWMNDELIGEFVQSKLQSISKVALSSSLIRYGFFKSIPNIEDLRIHCDTLPSGEVDLTHLRSLEKLRCISGVGPSGRPFLSTLSFPSNLRKLILFRCDLLPRVLTALCALLNLKTLKIERCVFERKDETEAEKWELAEGDVFRSLQFLHLRQLHLVSWEADWTNFLILCHLVMESCCQMKEIPSGIGHIPTLQSIKLNGCSAVEDSAKDIQKLQQSDYENYDIQLHIS